MSVDHLLHIFSTIEGSFTRSSQAFFLRTYLTLSKPMYDIMRAAFNHVKCSRQPRLIFVSLSLAPHALTSRCCSSFLPLSLSRSVDMNIMEGGGRCGENSVGGRIGQSVFPLSVIALSINRPPLRERENAPCLPSFLYRGPPYMTFATLWYSFKLPLSLCPINQYRGRWLQ